MTDKTWEAEDHAAPRNPTVERLSTALNHCQDINADLLAALEASQPLLQIAMVSARELDAVFLEQLQTTFAENLKTLAKAKDGKG